MRNPHSSGTPKSSPYRDSIEHFFLGIFVWIGSLYLPTFFSIAKSSVGDFLTLVFVLTSWIGFLVSLLAAVIIVRQICKDVRLAQSQRNSHHTRSK